MRSTFLTSSLTMMRRQHQVLKSAGRRRPIAHHYYLRQYSGSEDTRRQQQQQQQRQHRQVPLRPFEVEQYEGWLAKTGLSDSDVEPLKLKELLDLADDECQQLWDELSLGYPLYVQGDPLLRQEIITKAFPGLQGIHNINCLAPQEGIFCALQALLEGDHHHHVVVTAPVYQSLSEVPRSMGCTVSHWLPELVEDKNRNDGPHFRFDPDRLRQLLLQQQQQVTNTGTTTTTNSNNKLVVVANFPHNPTGALPTPKEWNEMVEICRHHGAYLFCDEMYRGLEHRNLHENTAISTLEPAAQIYERGISLSGLSKTYGLPGLRMGWIASRDEEFMKRVQQIKDYITMCSSTPTQVLSLMAVRNTDILVGRCQTIVQEVRNEVEAFCRQNPDVLEWSPPRAGSFAFPKLLPLHRASSAKEYCDDLLKRSDIMLLPSSLFEYGEDLHKKDNSRVRISLGRKSIPKYLKQWRNQGF